MWKKKAEDEKAKAEEIVEQDMKDKPLEFEDVPKKFQDEPFYVKGEDQGYLF